MEIQLNVAPDAASEKWKLARMQAEKFKYASVSDRLEICKLLCNNVLYGSRYLKLSLSRANFRREFCMLRLAGVRLYQNNEYR